MNNDVMHLKNGDFAILPEAPYSSTDVQEREDLGLTDEPEARGAPHYGWSGPTILRFAGHIPRKLAEQAQRVLHGRDSSCALPTGSVDHNINIYTTTFYWKTLESNVCWFALSCRDTQPTK